MNTGLPLEGVKVVDFSQFLSGPYCSLRLLDLGAEVLKVENPDGGDLTRRLYLSGARIGKDSTLFHAINRGKQSIVLDLKDPDGQAQAHDLVKSADIIIQNFRPGVAERLGLGYADLSRDHPKLIYGSISGYGPDGPWANLPGQDLLAQARSGVMWLSGNRDSGPVPIGIPVADITAGAHLAQGILAALFRRERKQVGALVETSLLEAMVDLQFEFLTTYLNNGAEPPRRSVSGSANGYQPAPYGLYETGDGHIALAMGDLVRLGEALDLPAIGTLAEAEGEDAGFEHRDTIQSLITERLRQESTSSIERHLAQCGVWCAKVLTWDELFESDSFKSLSLVQSVAGTGARLVAGPVRIDGTRARIRGLAPDLPS